MNQNYSKICLSLLADLSSRPKEVILRRFGLQGAEKETLEAIGKSFGITRERVRQIEAGGLEKIKPVAKNYQEIFENFYSYFGKQGGLKKEAILLEDLGGKNNQAQIYFLLSLDDNFIRFSESEDFYPLWTTDRNYLSVAQKSINFLFDKLKNIGKPVLFRELKSFQSADDAILNSCLEISKKIQKNQDDLYGLKDWPEINPRGIKDRAYLILKKLGKPLHFTDVTKNIEGALTQTVHNELIRDNRFVLVGRGIYALSEWGYAPGQVKDVISNVLKGSKKPLTKEEILDQVLKQRMVKANTILLNLSNRNYFQKNDQGKYTVREI